MKVAEKCMVDPEVKFGVFFDEELCPIPQSTCQESSEFSLAYRGSKIVRSWNTPKSARQRSATNQVTSKSFCSEKPPSPGRTGAVSSD
jgi:hypothetical protein